MCGEFTANGLWERLIQDFGGKPEGKRPFGGPGLRWQFNIYMDVLEVECAVIFCIELAQDRYKWLAFVMR